MSRRDVRQNPRAGSIPPAFSPLSLPGLMALYDAALGVTTVSGKVSQWNDSSKSGDSNRNLVQGTAGNRPTFVASDSNLAGQPSLSFSAADPDYLPPAGAWSVSIAQPVTVFGVGYTTSLAAQRTWFDDMALANHFLLVESSGGGLAFFAGNAFMAQATTTLNTPSAFYMVINGASSVFGLNAKTAQVTGTNPGSNGSTGLNLGTTAGLGNGFQGKKALIAVCSGALSQGNINAMMAYLGARFGLTIGS